MQPQAQAGLHFCKEVAQLSGNAEQHVSNAISPSCSSAHMVEDGEASAEQGLSAVRHGEPGSGVVSSQSMWEEAGRHLLMESTSTNGLGPIQVRGIFDDTHLTPFLPKMGDEAQIRRGDNE